MVFTFESFLVQCEFPVRVSDCISFLILFLLFIYFFYQMCFQKLSKFNLSNELKQNLHLWWNLNLDPPN